MKSHIFQYFNLILGITILVGIMMPIISKAQVTNRVSLGPGENPSMSADGRFIVFGSRIYDRETEQFSGIPGEGESPTISADGEILALLTDDGISIYNRQTGEILQVNDGRPFNAARDLSLSGDGRYVAFSTLSFLDDLNIFVHDYLTGETSKVSVDSNGIEGDDWSILPEISRDGRYVTFTSAAENLVSGDTNGVPDVFVHDRQTGETTRVSDERGSDSSISSDGRYVAYQSSGVHVYDRQTGMTITVPNPRSTSSNEHNFSPSISGDGRFVVFSKNDISSLSFRTDLFVFDTQTGEMTLISRGFDGQPNNASFGSYSPKISDSGRFVTFQSKATNLVPDDTNDLEKIFLHDLGIETEPSVSSAEFHLALLGVTIQQARDFIFSHVDEPEIIFNVASENNVTTSMLSEIVGFPTSDISAYFTSFGLDAAELDN